MSASRSFVVSLTGMWTCLALAVWVLAEKAQTVKVTPVGIIVDRTVWDSISLLLLLLGVAFAALTVYLPHRSLKKQGGKVR